MHPGRGATREDDLLPERFTEPIPDGPSEGRFVAMDEYERELDRYYTARGWSTDGIPMCGTLSELDLPEIGVDVGAGNELPG